jgi:hypothetical protein
MKNTQLGDSRRNLHSPLSSARLGRRPSFSLTLKKRGVTSCLISSREADLRVADRHRLQHGIRSAVVAIQSPSADHHSMLPDSDRNIPG